MNVNAVKHQAKLLKRKAYCYIWLLGKVQDLKFAIQDLVYG